MLPVRPSAKVLGQINMLARYQICSLRLRDRAHRPVFLGTCSRRPSSSVNHTPSPPNSSSSTNSALSLLHALLVLSRPSEPRQRLPSTSYFVPVSFFPWSKGPDPSRFYNSTFPPVYYSSRLSKKKNSRSFFFNLSSGLAFAS